MSSIFTVMDSGQWPLLDSNPMMMLLWMVSVYGTKAGSAFVSRNVLKNPIVSPFQSTSNNFNIASLTKAPRSGSLEIFLVISST